MRERFSAAQLEKILDQSAIYMCACPAQVCREILNLRELWAYQAGCRERPGNQDIHDLIAAATEQAHAGLEQCLSEILDREGWDRETLTMPPGLRQVRDEILAGA
jgi:hypothetical protein